MRTTILLVLVAATVAGACGGGGMLDGLGDRTSDLVAGSTTTTDPEEAVEEEAGGGGVVPATGVTWYNDGIDGEAIGLPAYTISEVWERGHDSGRFIQSSRAEISVALPGIAFPAEIPEEVAWVTSQLVYLEDVATLDAGLSAAFGLWELEPYSSEDGRVGVLRVGADRGDLTPGEVGLDVVTSGLSLLWSDGTYRYELFCRARLPEDLCHAMAESARPLRELLSTVP